MSNAEPAFHDHYFLGAGHVRSEQRTWMVIGLCSFMMVAEIVGGWLFGSIALMADGLHMSTHASALLLAALAYRYALRHATDPRFTFGTGKFGDLAGYTSAIVLAMIAIMIGYEAASRLFAPVPIHFNEAILIAVLGLIVNIVSALLLDADGRGHAHGQRVPDHDHDHDRCHPVQTSRGTLMLEIFEAGVPPRFRLSSISGSLPEPNTVTIETRRPDGARQVFAVTDRGGYLESIDTIPEPHAFIAVVALGGARDAHSVVFSEHHDAGTIHRDNNMRAAVTHVMADAAVSAAVIVGLVLARNFGWVWIDPVVGFFGAVVIAAWSYGLVRDTSAVLLDMNPDRPMEERLRSAIEVDGDRVTDLHLWRLGPGHLGAILSIATTRQRGPDHYRRLLDPFRSLSHVTIEVQRQAPLA